MPVPIPFDYQPRTRVIYGNGVLSQLGDLARALGSLRVLIVTDSGIMKAGHVSRADTYLRDAGLETAVFDQVHENPTTEDVATCVEFASQFSPDLIIGLGGGSSMDTAKGCNFLLTNGGRMHDYWGVGKASKPMLPLIAIPTTSGTGSECQSFALISDAETHVKMACGDPKAAARIALLDPELTISQPPRVTAVTGIDAIAHALETAVCKKRTPISSLFSLKSFQLLSDSFEQVLAHPTDVAARGSMLLGAALAGTAIENSMLGAAHSCANPLTADYDIVHGQAVGLMLPHVIRFNSALPEIAAIYQAYGGDLLTTQITQWLEAAALATRLRDLGVAAERIPQLAAGAAKQWTANFNPRPVEEADFVKLYEAAY